MKEVQHMMVQDHDHSDGNAGDRDNAIGGPVQGETARIGFHLTGGASTFDGLTARLERGGARAVGDLDSLAERLSREADFRAVIVFPNPVVELGDQLADGMTPAEAMAAWQERTKRLLATFRRDRRRLALLDGHAALVSSSRFGALLGERFSLQVDNDGGQTLDSGIKPAGLMHLLAAQALRQDEAASMLLSELEASALPLGPAYQVDVDALVAEESGGTASPKQKELREENDLLWSQLRQVQDELEARVFDGGKLEKLRLAKESLQKELEESRQEYLEERKELTDKLRWVSDDLAAIRQSLSWRLTSPLRRLLGLFTGGSNL